MISVHHELRDFACEIFFYLFFIKVYAVPQSFLIRFANMIYLVSQSLLIFSFVYFCVT